MRFNRNVEKKLRYIRPRTDIIKEIYTIGFPAIIAQALMSVMTYGINIVLVNVNEALVTAYGLYYKIQQFILFAAFGLRDAITPIVSFSHGMRDKKRIADGIKYGVGYTLALMIFGTVILEIIAAPLCSAFGLSTETESLCISATRIISLSFVFAGINIALQGVFQALDCGLSSLIVSLCRQLLFVLPVIYGLSLLISPDLQNAWIIWLTFIIAEFTTAVIAVGLMLKAYKNKVKNI